MRDVSTSYTSGVPRPPCLMFCVPMVASKESNLRLEDYLSEIPQPRHGISIANWDNG